MSDLVPANDLPANLVPASDLPGPQNPSTPPKLDSVASTMGPKDVPDSPPTGSVKQAPRTGVVDFMRGLPGALSAMGVNTLGQLAGRATAIFNPSAGKKVAETISYQPSERGEETSRILQRALEKSKLEGMGPLAMPAGQGATKVLSGAAPSEKAAAAVKSGFALTPSEAGGGTLARGVEGLAGEPKLAKGVSRKNAPVVNEKILTDLGLPKDAEVSIDTLKGVRTQAGKAYEAVRKTGKVATDGEYTKALDELGAKYKSAAQDFPDLVKADVEKVINGLKREAFDANSGVDMIKQLRESADQAFRSGDTGMGKVLRGGADAIEAQLDRHMTNKIMTGADAEISADMLKNFKEARQRIAKSYAAERALDGQGNFNPQAYAKQFVKGKPLSGGAKEVGEAAAASPRSFQKFPQGSVGAPTWSDAIMALMSGGKSLGKEAMMLGARPGARAALSSDTYQKLQGSQQSAAVPIPSPEALRVLQAAPMVGATQ